MGQANWLTLALLGAVLAAVVSVLSKKALKATDVFVALTLQSALMLLTLVTVVTLMGRWAQVRAMPRWAMGLIALSGVAAGLSWACGYRALQMSDVTKAGPIDKLSIAMAVVLAVVFLGERPKLLNWVGIVLMLVGAYCVAHQAAKNADDAARHDPAARHQTASSDSSHGGRPG